MYKEKVKLENKTGLHARPASIFVKEATNYKSEITLIKEEQRYNAKSIMGVLSMGASKDDILIIEAEGDDEKEAVNSLVELIKSMKE